MTEKESSGLESMGISSARPVILMDITMSMYNNKQRVIEDIYHLYYRHMESCALRILKNYQDSQDAVQDAFCNITATYELFVDASTPATAALVHIYTRNAAINIYNKNKRHSNVVMLCDNIEEKAKAIVDESTDVQWILIGKETAQMITQAIDRLDDMYRVPIIMKYYYDMRNIDIARVLNLECNTVNWRIFRAKRKLREILDDESYGLDTK